MELDLNALRVFVFVVEAHGITEAARRLGLPKSTVSRQVRDLEARLGETLLERHGRGLAATAAGRRLHEVARGGIGTLEALRQDLLAPPVAGRVRLRAPVILGRGLVQHAVADFLGRHPGVDVEVTLSDRFGALASDATDVACCVGLVPEPRHPRQSVGFVEARLFAAPALLAEYGAPRAPADLAAMPVLAQGCSPGGSARWMLNDARGATHRVAFTPRLVASDPDMLLAAAIAGRGVLRIATFMAEPHLRAGRLLPVLEGHVAERHEVLVATLRRPRDAAVRCLAGELAERLRERLRPGR